MNEQALYDALQAMSLEQLLVVAELQGHKTSDPEHGIGRDPELAEDTAYWREVILNRWYARYASHANWPD